MKKNVLVIGGGGRCHAIVKALKRSPRVQKIFCAPGNAGIAADAECVAIGVEDAEGIVKFVEENAIDMTVVGRRRLRPAGVVDALAAKGHKAFGYKSRCKNRKQQRVCQADNGQIQCPDSRIRSLRQLRAGMGLRKGRPLLKPS